MLFGCELNGAFIFRNEIQDATIEYALPKVLTDSPITVRSEGCAGTAVAKRIKCLVAVVSINNSVNVIHRVASTSS